MKDCIELPCSLTLFGYRIAVSVTLLLKKRTFVIMDFHSVEESRMKRVAYVFDLSHS